METYKSEHEAHHTPIEDTGLRPSDHDKEDLQVRGVAPVFNRNFRVPGSIAYTINAIISAEYFIISLAYVLYNGGRALLTFGMLVHLPGMACLYWSLGEMMSIAPTAGGQYRFVAENAPASAAKPLSYMVGWLGILGWQSFLTAVCFGAGTGIQGLIVLYRPDYTRPPWEGVLLTIAVVVMSYIINILLLRRLHLAVSGLDCLWHLSEEVVDASEKLPKVLWRSVGISWGFALLTTVLLAVYIPNIGQLLESPTGYPFLAVFEEAFGYLNAPGAKSLTTALTCLFLALFGFARDGGIPFAAFVTKMVYFDKTPVPVSSVSAVCLIVSALSCIYLGSATALNAFNSLAGVALAASYMVCIGVMLWCRIVDYESPYMKRTKWSVGRNTGIAVNVVAMIYISFNFVSMFFPTTPGFDADYFNWAIAVFALVFVIAAVFWLFERAHYAPARYIHAD